MGQGIKKYWGDVTNKNIEKIQQEMQSAGEAAKQKHIADTATEADLLNDEIYRFNDSVHKWRDYLQGKLQKENPNRSHAEIQQQVLKETNPSQMETPDIKTVRKRLMEINEHAWSTSDRNYLSPAEKSQFDKALKEAKHDQLNARVNTGLATGAIGLLGANALASRQEMNKQASVAMEGLYK